MLAAGRSDVQSGYYFITGDLEAIKDSIEDETGLSFEWQRLDGKKASRIIHKIPGLNFDNHDNYSALMDETIKKVVIMKDVFKKYIS